MEDSIELQTLFECRPKLVPSIRNNLDDISSFLRKEGVLTKRKFDEVTDSKSRDGPDERALIVLRALEDKIEEDDSIFKSFMDYISIKKQYSHLKDTIAAEYAKRGGVLKGAGGVVKVEGGVVKVAQKQVGDVTPPLKPKDLRLVKWKNDVGTVEQLKLYELLASDWKAAADLIGIPNALIKNIRRDNPEVGDCIREVIAKWMEESIKYTNYECTWKGMCELLRDAEYGAASKKLRQAIAAECSTINGNLTED